MGLAEIETFDKTMEQEMDKKFKGLKLKYTVDDAASKPIAYDDLVKMHEKAKADSLWPPDLTKLSLHEAVEVAQKANKDKELLDKMNETTAKVMSQYGPYSGTVDYVSKSEDDNMEIEISGFNKVGGMAQATVTIKGPTMGTEAKQQVAAMIADKVASGVADYVIQEHLQEIVAMVDFKAVSNLVLSKVLLSSGLADKDVIQMMLGGTKIKSGIELKSLAEKYMANMGAGIEDSAVIKTFVDWAEVFLSLDTVLKATSGKK